MFKKYSSLKNEPFDLGSDFENTEIEYQYNFDDLITQGVSEYNVNSCGLSPCENFLISKMNFLTWTRLQEEKLS